MGKYGRTPRASNPIDGINLYLLQTSCHSVAVPEIVLKFFSTLGIAQSFAYLELKIILASFISTFDFKMAPDYNPDDTLKIAKKWFSSDKLDGFVPFTAETSLKPTKFSLIITEK